MHNERLSNSIEGPKPASGALTRSLSTRRGNLSIEESHSAQLSKVSVCRTAKLGQRSGNYNDTQGRVPRASRTCSLCYASGEPTALGKEQGV